MSPPCPQENFNHTLADELNSASKASCQESVRGNVHDSENRAATLMPWICLPETWKILNAKQYSFRLKAVKV